MTTMVLGGLWHGANWTFVVWGALHGSYLIGHQLLNAGFQRAGVRPGGAASRWLSGAGLPLTFGLVLVTWVFFRAAGFSDAWTVLSARAGQHQAAAGAALSFRLYEVGIVAIAGLLVALEPWLVRTAEHRGIGGWWQFPFWMRGVAYASLVLSIVVFGGTTQKFIYFDF